MRNPEVLRTKPDYIVYEPKGLTDPPDAANEHFLVFERKDGRLAAVWTQSGFEGQYNQHIVFAESDAAGKVWSDPVIIAGHHYNKATGENMCSWAFPMVSKSGRIYVLYSRHTGRNDIATHTTGELTGIYSDDGGRSWSAPQAVPVPRTVWDSTDLSMPASGIIWQSPKRLIGDKFYSGITRWVSPSRYELDAVSWIDWHAVTDMIRFENIDLDPQPKDIVITLLTPGNTSLQYPNPRVPHLSSVQEATLNMLPDGRIMAIMRTVAGVPVYSLSDTRGENWSQPVALRYRDNAAEILHPLSPCPSYSLGNGEYVFFIHNHNGNFGPWVDHDSKARRPIYLLFGKYVAGSTQPVEFSAPIGWIDSDNVELNHRSDLALYASFTRTNGEFVLWYPDRKHFLVGKIIDPALRRNAVFLP